MGYCKCTDSNFMAKNYIVTKDLKLSLWADLLKARKKDIIFKYKTTDNKINE